MKLFFKAVAAAGMTAAIVSGCALDSVSMLPACVCGVSLAVVGAAGLMLRALS